MRDRVGFLLRLGARLFMSVLLLTVVSHGFGLHHHADNQFDPESCSLCRAAATPVLSASVAAVPMAPAPCLPGVATRLAGPPEAALELPPCRAPPHSLV